LLAAVAVGMTEVAVVALVGIGLAQVLVAAAHLPNHKQH
jgi:hypothetical protein